MVEEKHTEVQLQTTSGTYPEEDGKFDKVPSREQIGKFVEKAVRKLKITNTTGWVLTASGSSINPAQSWDEAGLGGKKVVLDYGPDHTGGGNA